MTSAWLRRGFTAAASVSLLSFIAAGCRQILGVEDPVPCTEDSGCDPGTAQPCLEGQCVDGECVYSPKPDGPTVDCTTCEDGEAIVAPGLGEACYTGPEGTDGAGQCRGGTLTCTDNAPVCEGEVLPGEERCGGDANGVDEDCDGEVDVGGVGCDCEPGQSMACYDGPRGTADVGECVSGTMECQETPDGNVFGECTGSVTPADFDSCLTSEDENCDDASPACSCAHQFSVSFGGTGSEESQGIAVEADGSLLLFAEFTSPTLTVGADTVTNEGSRDLVLVRFDESGNPITARAYGGTGFDQVAEVFVDGTDIWIAGYLGDGSVENFGSGASLTSVGGDGFIVKLNQMGMPIFKRKIGAAGNDHIRVVAKSPDGGIVVAGDFQGSIDVGGSQNLVATGTYDAFIASYAPDGSHRWSRRFGNAGSGIENASGLAVAPNGDVVFCGYTNDGVDFGGGPLTVNDYDPFMARFSADGTHLHSRVLNGPGFDAGGKCVALSDGSVWQVGGFSTSLDLDGEPGPEVTAQGTNPDMFLAHFDAEGEYLGSRSFNSEGQIIAPSVLGMEAGPDDAVFVAIHTSATVTFDQTYAPASGDAYILKLTPDGDLVCVKRISGTGGETSGEITVDDQGNFYGTGSFSSTNLNLGGGNLPNEGASDMFLVKYRQ